MLYMYRSPMTSTIILLISCKPTSCSVGGGCLHLDQVTTQVPAIVYGPSTLPGGSPAWPKFKACKLVILSIPWLGQVVPPMEGGGDWTGSQRRSRCMCMCVCINVCMRMCVCIRRCRGRHTDSFD